MSERIFVPRGRYAQPSPQTALAPVSETATAAFPDAPAPQALVLPAALRARYSTARQEQGFHPSTQQRAFFDWVSNGSGNLILKASAGCGKTTTLLHAVPLMSGFVFFGAYNRAIANEIVEKLKENRFDRKGVKAGTLHAAGLYDLRRVFPKITDPEDRKTHRVIDTMKQENPRVDLARGFIAKMASFGKQFLMGCAERPELYDMRAWQAICEHFSVDCDLIEDIRLEEALEWAVDAFERSRVQIAHGIIDFDDMVYGPIAYGITLFPNDWVLIDEAQDINPARRELTRRLMKRAGRAIFVGDDRQSIYGFTGAGGDSLQKIREEFNCAELPLTVTYRCPKLVVQYVTQWVGEGHIVAHETAPEGVVRPVAYSPTKPCLYCTNLNEAAQREHDAEVAAGKKCTSCWGTREMPAALWYEQDAPTIEDVILCRYTRPLIQTAYSMIKNGIACKVEGRDIGKGLIALAQQWRIKSLTTLEERLATYLAREIQKAKEKDSERRAQEVEDKVTTLRIFIDRTRAKGKHTIDDLVTEIDSMFGDNVKDVITLCTGHKSKGREWPRVFWIQCAQRMRPRKEWEAIQEDNVMYVIGTRAKRELILVPESLMEGGK